LGIHHVFTLPGGNSMHLNDSFGHHPDITPVYMLHESGAAIAVEAYAKASGRPGVCIVTAGPGVTNALTGCAAAHLESTPVLFISGNAKVADLDRRDQFSLRQAAQQDVQTIEIVKSVTKSAVEPCAVDELPEVLEMLALQMLSGRPGPVWLSVPLDIQAQDIGDPEIRLPQIEHPMLFQDDIERVVEALDVSSRPLILLGAGVNIANARTEAAELIDHLGIPVITTWLGTNLIDYGHPLFIGRPGPAGLRAANKVLQEADLLISIGARLDPVTTAYNVRDFGRNATRIMVDIDKAELYKNRDGIELGIRADAKDFIRVLQAQAHSAIRPAWIEHCQSIKEHYQFETLGNSPSYALTNILSGVTAPNDIFANGVASYACAIFSVGFKQKAGQRFYSTYALGSMGCDIPNAIGACLGSGGKRTICVTGDGSFMQNIQELEVVRRLNLPIVFFVADNGGYGCIERSQQRAYGRTSGAGTDSGLTLPYISLMTKPLMDTWSVIEMNTYTIKRALQHTPGVTLYDAYHDAELPHVVTTIGADGMPHSGTLDKMWPDEN
jgi:acetolactate synthase-1/2/3 large subunit